MTYADGTTDDEYGNLAMFVTGSISQMEKWGRVGPFMVVSSYELGYANIEGVPVTVDNRIEHGSIYVLTEEDYAGMQEELEAYANAYRLTEEQEEAARWN